MGKRRPIQAGAVGKARSEALRLDKGTEMLKTFTLIDVFRIMQVSPLKEDTWPAGAACRIEYEKVYGHPPEKELRTKTQGCGSHCFAVYPWEFFGAASEIVQALHLERQSQMDLFQKPQGGQDVG